MNKFTKQLAATRAQLERLERLSHEAPDLLEDGGHGIYIECNKARVVICNCERTPEHWLALARKYRAANWQRDGGDWDGELGGVLLTILSPERKAEKQPQPLFPVETEAAQITERIDRAMAATPIVERGNA